MAARRGVVAGQWLARAQNGQAAPLPIAARYPTSRSIRLLPCATAMTTRTSLHGWSKKCAEARERLARLITAVKAERAGWDEREQLLGKLALAAAEPTAPTSAA